MRLRRPVAAMLSSRPFTDFGIIGILRSPQRGRLEKLLRTGQVRVDGKRARAGDPVAPGQAIRVPPLAEPSTPPPVRRVRPQDEELLRRLVLYRDSSAIVL